jgi:hypothetical protein
MKHDNLMIELLSVSRSVPRAGLTSGRRKENISDKILGWSNRIPMIEMFGESDRMLIQPGAELFGCWFLKDSDDIFAWWVNRMLMFGHVALVGAYRRFMVLKRIARTVKYYSSTPLQVQNTGAHSLPSQVDQTKMRRGHD